MADQLRKSLVGAQGYTNTPAPPHSMQSPMSNTTWTSQATSPIPSVRTPSVKVPPARAQPSLASPQSHVFAYDATGNEPELQRSLGLGFMTPSEEQNAVVLEKPVRRTSARSRPARALSMVDQYKEMEDTSLGMVEKANVSRTAGVEPICPEPLPELSPKESKNDDENDALDMLISALEEEYPSDIQTAPERQKQQAEATSIDMDPPISQMEPNSVSLPTRAPALERVATPAESESGPHEPVQNTSVPRPPTHLHVWPELSHHLPPVEQEAPLTHGDIRRIYAEMLAEQEAAKQAKKPIGKVLRRMRTLLDSSSAPPQPLSKARSQAEPYPTSRKSEIKPDYYSVADKEMLRIALYSSHNQMPDSKMPTPSPTASTNENAPPDNPSTPVVRSLRSARRLESNTCPRPNVTSLRERKGFPRGMHMTTQGLR